MPENEELNIDQSQNEVENPVIESNENEAPAESTLLNQARTGEVDFRSLDPSTRRKVLDEERESLSPREQRLWEYGWRPKYLFLGKDRNGNDVPYKTADEFERTLKIPSVSKERDNHVLEENKRLKEELERVSKLTKINIERGLQAEEAQIDIEIKTAKEYGDFDAYEKAEAKKRLLQEDKNNIQKYYEAPKEQQHKPSEAEVVSKLTPEDQDVYFEFKSNNLWFGIDNTLSEFAGKEWQAIQYAPNMSFKQKLDYIQKRTATAFPSKFPNKNINFMPTSNNNQNAPLNQKPANEMTYAKLTDMDKKRVDRLVLSGQFTSREAVIKRFFPNKK